MEEAGGLQLKEMSALCLNTVMLTALINIGPIIALCKWYMSFQGMAVMYPPILCTLCSSNDLDFQLAADF